MIRSKNKYRFIVEVESDKDNIDEVKCKLDNILYFCFWDNFTLEVLGEGIAYERLH